ncbi:hypothetical protein D9M72_133880 [compost metagenome]
MGQRADRVEAKVAPQLQPDLVADVVAHRRLQVGRHHHFAEPGHAGRTAAVRLAQREFLAIHMLDHAGRHDFGSRIDHAADRALRPQAAPLPAARVDAFQRRARQLAAVLVEVPVRNAIDAGHDRGFRAQQRLDQVDHARHRMRLQRNEDIVLRPQLARIAGAAHPRRALLAVDQQPHPVFLHRRQVRTARDEADIGSRTRKLRPDIAANGARAVDTHFHLLSP